MAQQRPTYRVIMQVKRFWLQGARLPQILALYRETSRRQFLRELRGFGATIGMLYVADRLSWRNAAASAVAAKNVSQQSVGQTSSAEGWNTLPIVKGEKTPHSQGGSLIPDNLYVVVSAAKNRTSPDTSSDNNLSSELSILTVNTLWLEIERGHRDNAGTNFVFSRGRVAGPESLAVEETYVAQHLLEKVVDASLIPSYLVSPSVEIVLSSETVDIDKFIVRRAKYDLTSVWGNQPIAAGTVLGEWQKAVAVSFAEAKAGSVASTVNVCEASGAGPCEFAVYSTAGGAIDVISRINNPRAPQHPDVFVIVRIGENSVRVGFVTPDALPAAYGNQAATIAETATAFTGASAERLAMDISSLEAAGVFLPGMDEANQFVERKSPFTEQQLTDHGDYQTDGQYTYEKVDSRYLARVYGTKDQQTAILVEAQTVVTEAGVAWLTLPKITPDIDLYLLTYAEVAGLEYEEVRNELQVDTRTNKNGQTSFLLASGAQPFMICRDISRGVWEYAGIGDVGMASAAIRVGTTVDGAENYTHPAYEQTVRQEFNAINFMAMDYVMRTWPYLATRFVRVAKETQSSMRLHTSFFHQSLREEAQYGQSFSSQEAMDRFIDEHVERLFDLLDTAIPQTIRGQFPIDVLFANEATWLYEPTGNRGLEDSPLKTFYGDNWPAVTYIKLFDEAIKRGWKPGEDVHFGIGNYGIEMANQKRAYDLKYVSGVRSEIAEKLDMPVEDVPMVYFIQGTTDADATTGRLSAKLFLSLDAEAAIQQLVETFQAYASNSPNDQTPVRLNELGSYGLSEEEQIEYIERFTEAAKRSSVVSEMSFWSALRPPEINQLDQSLFDVSKELTLEGSRRPTTKGYRPTRLYYALKAALYRTNT